MVKSAVIVLGTLGLVAAAPVRREVPQEHSHEKILRNVNTFLKVNNPDNIVDAVFGLLGNAAASQGLGNFKDPDCLQTGIADRAFTNAKAAGDVQGMTDALTFRAIERNTGSVGLKSATCTSFTPVNPEIAALSQHQDPASDGAAETNKAITLELAKQIQSIGGNPQDALLSGTFAPGKIGDPTAKGNTCDDANDAEGCIFSQNLIVFDATADEIDAAVGGSGNDNSNDNANQNQNDNSNDNSGANENSGAAQGGNVDLGSCSDPSVKFAAGIDGRKATEFAFIPNNLADFNHGSALNPDIIFQFICDTFVNKCGFKNGDATVNLCRAAQKTADQFGKTGAAADSFNSAFGIQTNFAAVNTAAPAAGGNNGGNNANNNKNNNNGKNNNNNNAGAAAGNGALDFGTCSNPTVQFGPGLDGRKENSFQAVNLQDFNHGSALNSGVITDFICLQFINKCGLNNESPAVQACKKGEAAATALGKVGAAADAFNAALGFKTNFAAVQ